MPDYYYWEDILDLSPEVEAECSKTFDQIRNGEYKSACLKKLKGHYLWSARVDYEKRLLFTVIRVEGLEYLQFLELSYKHYKDSRILRNPKLLKRYRESREEALLQEKPWEDAHGTGLGGIHRAKRTYKAKPLRWFNHHLIELSDEQRKLQSIQTPALISGLAGSGKTSTVLLALPKLRGSYNNIVCIANTPGLRNDMQRAWNGLPQATEPGCSVTFLTWLEWAKNIDKSLVGKTLAGEQEFKTWYQANASEIARNHRVDIPAPFGALKIRDKRQRALHADAEASAIYQELRIAFGYTSEAYQALGTRFSLFAKQSAERHFVRELIIPAWKKHCAGSHLVDPSIVSLAPGALDGLLWIEEAQDFSCRQLRDLLSYAGSRLQFIACAGEYQRLNDSLPFIDHLQQMVYEAGSSLLREVLPGSFRVPTVLEGAVQLLMDWSVHDAGGVQDREQVRRFESTLSKHALPGSVHWLDRDDMPSHLLDAIRTFGANNPEFAVLTPREYADEARKVFGDNVLVCTVEAVKGMQFKTGVHYRMLDTLPCERISCVHETGSDTGAGNSNHRPKNRIGNWRNATTYHRLFTAYTRFSERLMVIEAGTGKYNTSTLSNALRSSIPADMPLTLSNDPVDTSRQAWAKRVRQFIRQGNHDTAKRLYIEKCSGSAEDFASLVRRLERRVEPVMPQEPVTESSCSSSNSPASSSVPLAPVAPWRGRRRKKATPQKALPSEAYAKDMLARLFNPDDPVCMTAFSEWSDNILEKESIEDSEEDRVLNIFTTPVNLFPWLTLEQFGMQFNQSPQALRSSMMYWVFKNTSQGRDKVLNELLKHSPTLITELANYFRQIYHAKDFCFDPRYADLRYLMLLRNKTGPASQLLKEINIRAGFPPYANAVLDLSILHIPVEYQTLCLNLRMQPVSEWSRYINESAPGARNWAGSLIDEMQKQVEDSQERWRMCLETGNLMQAVRTFFMVGRRLDICKENKNNPLMRLRKTAQSCKSPARMLEAINHEIQNCGKNWFHPLYSALSAVRESLMEALSKGVAPDAGMRASSSSAGFFQPPPAQSIDIKNITLPALFANDEEVAKQGCTSLFDWLCDETHPTRQHTLKRMLCGENPFLTKLFAMVLSQYVLTGHFNKAFLDIQRLAMIVDTVHGSCIIETFAILLKVSSTELLHAIVAYHPKECDPWSILLHQAPECAWESLVTPEVSRQPGYAEYAHVYARMKGIFSQANKRGRGLMESCGHSTSLRDNLRMALGFINRPDSKITDREAAIVYALTEQINTDASICDETLTELIASTRPISGLPPAGLLAGYIRAFTDPFILSRLSAISPAEPGAATYRLV